MFEVKRTTVILTLCAVFTIYGELSHAITNSTFLTNNASFIVSLLDQ